MAERGIGKPCPGCTPALIEKQIARWADAYPTCVACLNHGALYHAKFKLAGPAREEADAEG